ncbi:MAG: hypothetical protein HQL43_08390 [Alphaproteobacteria bacterium]|nr:hypothetical protein [Alphaproteobacteria bacterium]
MKCDGLSDQAPCGSKASVTTKSGRHLCRDCAVDYGGEFATPEDENRVKWFIDSLMESDDGT